MPVRSETIGDTSIHADVDIAYSVIAYNRKRQVIRSISEDGRSACPTTALVPHGRQCLTP